MGKEKPIIFNSEMVRNILENRKHQTRRVIVLKNPDDWSLQGVFIDPEVMDLETGNPIQKYGLYAIFEHNEMGECFQSFKCPYGQIGDHLWVRETWEPSYQGLDCLYKADDHTGIFAFNGPWRPSIFMPRWASRITLEVVNIHVERVQDISQQDAIAEGLREMTEYHLSHNPYEPGICDNPCNSFMLLWDRINLKRGYSWAFNPFVWVIEFKRITGDNHA